MEEIKMISPYFSDADLISSLRKYYGVDERFTVDFRYWLHTAKRVKDGILISVGSRKFLIGEFTGSVIREVK